MWKTEKKMRTPIEDEDAGAQIAPIVKLEEVFVSNREDNEDVILNLGRREPSAVSLLLTAIEDDFFNCPGRDIKLLQRSNACTVLFDSCCKLSCAH